MWERPGPPETGDLQQMYMRIGFEKTSQLLVIVTGCSLAEALDGPFVRVVPVASCQISFADLR
jgi:hypothetical protein